MRLARRWPPAALLCPGLCTLWLIFAAAGTNEVGRQFLEENKERPGVITLKSGLQYKVLRKGEGKHSPHASTPCDVHYTGTTPSLTPDALNAETQWNAFDSSYDRGKPATFAPNQVIKGWTEAMQLMVEGDLWEMYIPSELGYGNEGAGKDIKGGDVLIFQMEIVKINGRKKLAVTCNLKTQEHCDAAEVGVLEDWGGKSQEAIQDEIASLKEQFAHPEMTTDKKAIYEKLRVLKMILKQRQNRAEL
eukprot:gnl/TRDRNA2_/TRDRNA2_29800_c0_seq1.p1 gnl/TRDRNA2_/TRDRNA2_29800_c0~~gnl/TRDRNA2_/TRDRNA2_29800_c0_seq1.p1  ORF type:complete len:247 (+),score=48.39 gnl/TRDRNA2_/TRDRNA2_29800_c0_seq1:122-862(+)